MTNSWAAGWVNGDIPTGAEFAKGSGSIYSTRLAIAAATLDLSGIIGAYGDLEITWQARGTTAATSTDMSLRLNNDSGANYDREQATALGATAGAGEAFAETSELVSTIPAASAAAGLAGAGSILIPNYAGTAFNKQALTWSGHKVGTASGNLVKRDHAIFWRSSAAITRVTLILAAGNFEVGSYINVRVIGI